VHFCCVAIDVGMGMSMGMSMRGRLKATRNGL